MPTAHQDGYSALINVPMLVRTDVLDLVGSYQDSRLDREIPFAAGALDPDDMETWRWYVCLLAEKIRRIDPLVYQFQFRDEEGTVTSGHVMPESNSLRDITKAAQKHANDSSEAVVVYVMPEEGDEWLWATTVSPD